MSEKQGKYKNLIYEKKPSTSNRRVLVGTLAALAVFAVFPNDTQALTNQNSYQDTSGTFRQSLSLDTKTGKASCQVAAESYESFFNSLSLIMSIQRYHNKKWQTDNYFDQFDSISKANPLNRQQISGSVQGSYSVKQLKNRSSKNPIRLNCMSGYSENNLTLPSRIFK